MKFRGTNQYSLYYVKDEWYQDGPDSAGQKIFRTMYLADAKLFGDKQEVEELIEELEFIPERVFIEYVTDKMLESARKEKFKATLAGDYIGARG